MLHKRYFEMSVIRYPGGIFHQDYRVESNFSHRRQSEYRTYNNTAQRLRRKEYSTCTYHNMMHDVRMQLNMKGAETTWVALDPPRRTIPIVRGAQRKVIYDYHVIMSGILQQDRGSIPIDQDWSSAPYPAAKAYFVTYRKMIS